MITGLARAGINALVELAADKTPRGRTGRLRDNPQVQDAVGRADAILNAGRLYRNAMIAELWNALADGRETTLEQRARRGRRRQLTLIAATSVIELGRSACSPPLTSPFNAANVRKSVGSFFAE